MQEIRSSKRLSRWMEDASVLLVVERVEKEKKDGA